MAKRCERCQLTFQTWTLYRDHMLLAGCLSVIRPERLTDRTVDQIVADVEKGRLAPFLLGWDGPTHKCGTPKLPEQKVHVRVCAPKPLNVAGFMSKVAAQLKSQIKEAENARGADTAGMADGDELQAHAGADKA